MKKMLISLRDVDEALKFNEKVNSFPCDFDLEVSRNYIDAKSLMALLALDLTNVMRLYVYADGELLREVEGSLAAYIVHKPSVKVDER